MKKKLLASAAMAIAIGCTAAIAQEGGQGTGGGMSHSPGGAQHQPSTGTGTGGTSGTGGAVRHNQVAPGGSAAQNQAIPEKQGMGPPKGASQNEERGHSARQRGAEENSGTMQRSGQEHNMQRGAEENNRSNRQRGAEENSRTMQRGAEENNRTKENSRTMQRGGQENNMRRGAEENNRTNMQRGVEQNRSNMRGAEENERGGAVRENRETDTRIQEHGGRTGSAGRSVQLSENQRTQIKSIIVKDRDVPREDSANFSVRVGTTVPHSVHVAPLPSDVIEVVPEYRGYDYIVVRDQLLIIDPDTMEIVAVLPA